MDVAINALPTVNAGIDQAVCDDGTSVTLSGSGATSYVWDNGVTDGLAFVPPLGTATYTVTGTDGNGCVNTDQVDVTVNTVPQINSFSNIVTCGQYILPSINGQNLTGNQLYYSSMDGAGTVYQPGDVISSDVVLYAFDEDLGCSDEQVLNIVINSSSITLGNDTLICDGNSITLNPGAGYSAY